MTGKQATVGWLGLLLVVANVLDGALRPAMAVITGNGVHAHGGGGGWNPSKLIPGHGVGPGGLIPDIPMVPQGPVTGIPLSPISYVTPTQTNPGALPATGVWA